MTYVHSLKIQSIVTGAGLHKNITLIMDKECCIFRIMAFYLAILCSLVGSYWDQTKDLAS